MGLLKSKWDFLNDLLTKNWNFKGKRITNAGAARDKYDYVILKQLEERVSQTTFGTLNPDQKPSNPNANDVFISTDFGHMYYYTGSAWQRLTASDYVGWFRTAPTEPGWHICDGSINIRRSKSDGTTELITVPTLNAKVVPRFDTAYSGPTPTNAVAPTGTATNTVATNQAEAAHSHSVVITSGTPSGTTSVETGVVTPVNVGSAGHTHLVSGNTGAGSSHNHTQDTHGHTITINADGHDKLMDGLPYIKL